MFRSRFRHAARERRPRVGRHYGIMNVNPDTDRLPPAGVSGVTKAGNELPQQIW